MNQHAIEKTELNKILAIAATYATLQGGKERLISTHPTADAIEAKHRLKETEEGIALLFRYGICKIENFPTFTDELTRAKKGSTLSCGELLKVENLLRSTRIAYRSVTSVSDEEITLVKALADKLYFDERLEEDIRTKIYC